MGTNSSIPQFLNPSIEQKMRIHKDGYTTGSHKPYALNFGSILNSNRGILISNNPLFKHHCYWHYMVQVTLEWCIRPCFFDQLVFKKELLVEHEVTWNSIYNPGNRVTMVFKSNQMSNAIFSVLYILMWWVNVLGVYFPVKYYHFMTQHLIIVVFEIWNICWYNIC